MKKRFLLALSFLLAVSLAACGGGTGQETPAGDHQSIRVGSKNFTESLIVSEIYALALEDAGFDVERVQNIASSLVHTSIINDEIDLYPEYTGTGLLVHLKEPMEVDPELVFEKVKEGYAKEFDLVWLDYAQANDSQGLAIRKEIADELDITTISDLQEHAPELRFASQGEFDMREDGLAGLQEVYGPFDFASSQVYTNEIKYQILLNDEADVTPVYTTEGQLVDKDHFLVLEDDQAFWPPYNLAPVIQKGVLDAYPEIAGILAAVNLQLDTESVIRLNAEADIDGLSYEEVAKKFYEELGL